MKYTEEEKKAIEEARNNILRGNDIESAMLILEKCALDGLVLVSGRINIFKIAVRQVLNFLTEYKEKGYLDVVREKVSVKNELFEKNNLIEKQRKEIERLNQVESDYNWRMRASNEEILKRGYVSKEEYNKLLNSKVGVDLSYDDYISKEAIREKIKELKYSDKNEKLEDLMYRNNWTCYELFQYILKELLGE